MIKKGMYLQFKHGTEIVKKASNDRSTGDIVTDKNTYSTDFIYRWLEFGFVKLLNSDKTEYDFLARI